MNAYKVSLLCFEIIFSRPFLVLRYADARSRLPAALSCSRLKKDPQRGPHPWSQFLSIPNNSWELQSTIARFDPVANSWTKLGNLKVYRYGHGVIQVDNEFIVVGGCKDDDCKNSVPTESCKLNEQSTACTTRQPQLSYFAFYPELMLIQ